MGQEQYESPPWRVGQSYDVHPLVPGRRLIIGGVDIPHSKGLLGHSDADVLYHSISDALLGALALGDLGKFFPDTSPEWKDKDSGEILKRVFEKIAMSGYLVGNIDSTIIAEKPKMAPHIPQMQKNISSILEIPTDRVSVKARTHEKIGSLGREEGIAALSIVGLWRKKS